MIKYALRNDDNTIRGFTLRNNGDPIDEASQEWIDYLSRFSNYSTASKLSVMRYLKSTDEWSSVRSLLDNNQDAKEEWDAASELHIDDPTLLQMAQVLGWDATKIQLIFNEAALIG